MTAVIGCPTGLGDYARATIPKMRTMARQIPLFVFLFFSALPMLAAGILLFAGLRARRQAATLKGTETSNIGMAKDGYCEFEGRAEAIDGRLLSSPLTGSPCVWYYAKVEGFTRPRRNEPGHWATLRETTSSAPFFLRDSTGVCTVFPWQAEVTPSDKSQWYGSSENPSDRNPPRVDPSESAQPMLEGNEPFRYFEERIYDDRPLVIAGEFTQGRFDQSSAAEDDEDEEPLEAVEPDEADAWSDDVISDELSTKAAETTRARIWRGTGKKPFIITTQLQAVHVAASEMGSQVAFVMAAVFAGLAVLMLYARFG